MSMRLFALGTAFAIVAAFAAPSVASASPELRDSAGRVAVGAELTATSTNTKITNTPFGTMQCTHVLFKTIVDANTGTHVTAHGPVGAATNCSSQEKAFTVTKLALTSLVTSGSDKGTMTLTFIVDLGAFSCHYEGSGAFTYETGSSKPQIHVPGIALKSSSEICGAEEGSPIYEGDSSITTESNGSTVWIQ